MKIGELAERAGVNIQTVRFYEREQILRKPARTAAGYRTYVEKDLQRVVFVKVCQSLGFTLTEIKTLMPMHACIGPIPESDGKPLQEMCAVAAERLRAIDEKITTLEKMRQSLLEFLNQPTECPSHKLRRPLPHKSS